MIDMTTNKKLTSDDMKRAGIGERYWLVKLDSIPLDAHYRSKIQKYVGGVDRARKDGVGMILMGELRSGKTSAAVIILKHVIVHGGTGFLVRVDSIRSAVVDQEDFDELETVESRMQSCDFLVLDDLGREFSKGFVASLIEKIIRDRYDAKKPTIITTNLSLKELESKYPSCYQIMVGTMGVVQVAGVDWVAEEKEALRKFANG